MSERPRGSGPPPRAWATTARVKWMLRVTIDVRIDASRARRRPNMRRTIFAGIVGAALIVPAAFPRADDTLHADEIIQALVGHKINGVTAKGDKWSGIYKPDGTAE